MPHTRNTLVIGAVAGGASAAARLRRLDEHARIVVFEKGPDPSFGTLFEIRHHKLVSVQMVIELTIGSTVAQRTAGCHTSLEARSKIAPSLACRLLSH